jgi:hypothetical protein
MTTPAKDIMLDALPNTLFASTHTAAPGESGANEVSGGTYARKSFTIGASSSANRDSTSQPVLDIPAGTTVTHVGYWTAVTGGTFLGYKAITAETFSNAGTLTVSDVDITITDPV